MHAAQCMPERAIGITRGCMADVRNSVAVLVGESDRIRYVPLPDFYGTNADTLTFRAWDQTDGSPSGRRRVDVTVNGDMTAFSRDTGTATVSVNAVNDAPVLYNTGAMSLQGIVEDAAGTNAPTAVKDIIDSSSANSGNAIVDVDAVLGGTQPEGIAVIGVHDDVTIGQWQYSAGGAPWRAFAADGVAVGDGVTDDTWGRP